MNETYYYIDVTSDCQSSQSSYINRTGATFGSSWVTHIEGGIKLTFRDWDSLFLKMNMIWTSFSLYQNIRFLIFSVYIWKKEARKRMLNFRQMPRFIIINEAT